jgi:TonB family protein
LSDKERKTGRSPRRRDPLHIPWAYSLGETRELPLCGDEHPLRREEGRWLLWGAAVAVVLVLALFAAWRWDAARRPAAMARRPVELPVRRFTPGRAGPLRMMPQLSIDDGTDAREQAASRARRPPVPSPPRPAPPPVSSGELVPVPSLARAPADSLAAPVSDDVDVTLYDAIEMRLPAQMNPCFVLERLAKPEYPVGVSEQDRRRSAITVEVAFFVNLQGNVTASYILKSDGATVFNEPVLRAVNAWKFAPVTDPACPPLGFWIRLPVIFHSPYRLRKDLLLPGLQGTSRAKLEPTAAAVGSLA